MHGICILLSFSQMSHNYSEYGICISNFIWFTLTRAVLVDTAGLVAAVDLLLLDMEVLPESRLVFSSCGDD